MVCVADFVDLTFLFVRRRTKVTRPASFSVEILGLFLLDVAEASVGPLILFPCWDSHVPLPGLLVRVFLLMPGGVSTSLWFVE